MAAYHIRKRLAFAKDYGDKTNRFWCNVEFTDETRLQRHAKDTRLRVRRPKNERHSTRFAAPTLKYGGDSIMFWGVINWHGQGPLILVEDTLDNKDYADLLLDTIPETLEDLNLIHPYILDDNATAHTTSHVKRQNVD